VAREVGTKASSAVKALLRGVAGTWKDLTDSVNSMASKPHRQVRNIAEVATPWRRAIVEEITVNVSGEILQLKETLNTMVDQLNAVCRRSDARGARSRSDGSRRPGPVTGVGRHWKDLTDSVNSMAGNLTAQVRNIAEVATAIGAATSPAKITVDVRGEILQLKKTLNTMVTSSTASPAKLTRVGARSHRRPARRPGQTCPASPAPGKT